MTPSDLAHPDAPAFCNAEQTSALLPYPDLIDAVAQAARDQQAGLICAPTRQAVPFPDGSIMLSMPATAADIGIHKLANVFASNRTLSLPTIHGVMSVFDGLTGRLRLLLDGPTVTARRTAAVSLLTAQHLMAGEPQHAVVVGTGAQARGHVQALLTLYPRLRIDVIGHSAAKALAFAGQQRSTLVRSVRAVPEEADLIILATTSAVPLYDQLPRADRLIIGVGAYRPDLAEIGARTLAGSQIVVDDLAGARDEAGDLLQAGVDWGRVQTLAALLLSPVAEGPAVFKSVGCAAWDLAAARCALKNL